MTRLKWGDLKDRFYESGIDRGVLYPPNGPAVAWNGIVSVEETPTGATPRSFYIDGVMYLQVPSNETFEGTINAIHRPIEFAICDGISPGLNGMMITGQPRRPFGFSFRTLIGTATDDEYGYNIHLVYNVLAQPSIRRHNTLSNSAAPNSFSWRFTARPPSMAGYKRTAHLIIDSRFAPAELLNNLEDILYGSNAAAPRLPSPQEIFELGFGIVVTDHGDGSFSISGPDDLVYMLDETSWEVNSPTAIFVEEDVYTIGSI